MDNQEKNPPLAVIVLTYNSSEICERCLSDLTKQRGIDLEVVVVDNCSRKEEREKIRALCQANRCTFLPNDVNAGYNAGNNVGLRYAAERGHAFAAIANPDMEFPEPGYFAKLLAAITVDGQIAAVGSDIQTPEGIHQNPRNYPPAKWQNSFSWIGECLRRKDPAAKTPPWVADPSRTGYCDGLNGCCLLLRMSFLKSAGFFDEGVFLYGEEPILAAQVRQCGMKLYYVADFTAIHNHRKSKEPDYWSTSRHWRHSQFYSLRKYSGFPFYGKWFASLSLFLKFLTLDTFHILKDFAGKLQFRKNSLPKN